MLVSIIIPCFNVEDYIEECIQSVLNQKHSDIEIICVDNDSSDKTFSILQRLALQYPNQIKVLQEYKKGAPAARNAGIAIAKGEWIQFLDADDLLLPEKIQHQLALISNKPNSAFVVGPYFSQDVNGNKIIRTLKIKDVFKAIFTTNLGITSSNLFNAEKVREIFGWNEELKSSQEADLMFRLLKKGDDLIFDDIPYTIIRERVSGQISQRNPKEKWLHYISLRLEIINFLKQRKSEYFLKEKSFYYGNLFTQLRTLAKYNVQEADVIFRNNFEPSFIKGDELPFSIYKVMFKVLGFKKTEQLKKIFNRG